MALQAPEEEQARLSPSANLREGLHQLKNATKPCFRWCREWGASRSCGSGCPLSASWSSRCFSAATSLVEHHFPSVLPTAHANSTHTHRTSQSPNAPASLSLAPRCGALLWTLETAAGGWSEGTCSISMHPGSSNLVAEAGERFCIIPPVATGDAPVEQKSLPCPGSPTSPAANRRPRAVLWTWRCHMHSCGANTSMPEGSCSGGTFAGWHESCINNRSEERLPSAS